MRLVPVQPVPTSTLSGTCKVRRAGHERAHLGGRLIDEILADFEYQFVVHLHEQARRTPGC